MLHTYSRAGACCVVLVEETFGLSVAKVCVRCRVGGVLLRVRADV